MKNIVLIGFMGCGKSSIGAKLAKVFQCPLIDTDQVLEEEFGCTISEFFEREGEEEFRKRETMLLERFIQKKEKMVLATGGGMPLRAENAALLKKIGTVFFLKVTPEETLARLENDTTRPLLMGEDKEKKVRKLLAERMPKYMAAADYVIETDGKSFYEIINEVETAIK